MIWTLGYYTMIILITSLTSTTGEASNSTFLQGNSSLPQENPPESRTIPSDILPQCSETHLNFTHVILCHNTERYKKFTNDSTEINYWMHCWKTSCWRRFEKFKTKTQLRVNNLIYYDPFNRLSLMILLGGLSYSNQVMSVLGSVSEIYQTFLNNTLTEINDRKYLNNNSDIFNCEHLFPDCRDDLHEKYLDFLNTLSQMETIHVIRKYVNPTILVVIFCVGILLNGTLILMFVRNNELRIIPNTMTMHIVVCDVLLLVIVMPLYYYVVDYGIGVVEPEFGPSVATCQLLLLFVGAFSVLAMSIQRYLAISMSLTTSSNWLFNNPRCYVFVSILAVWLSSIGLVASLYFTTHYHIVYGNQIIWPPVLVRVITPILITIAVTIFNVLTSIKIKKSARVIPGETARAQTELLRSRYRSSNIIIALTVVFWITHVVFMLRDLSGFLSVPLKYHYYSECAKNYLYFFSASLNPIALFITSKKFRVLFKMYFFRCS